MSKMGNSLTYRERPLFDVCPEAEQMSYYHYASNTMTGWRRNQEDRLSHHPFFEGDWSFYGVYDGHGGGFVSTYLAKHFPEYLRHFIKKNNPPPEAAGDLADAGDPADAGNPVEALQHAFLVCDQHLYNLPEEEVKCICEIDRRISEQNETGESKAFRTILAEFALKNQVRTSNEDGSDPGTSNNVVLPDAERVKNEIMTETLKFLLTEKLQPEDSDDDDENYEAEAENVNGSGTDSDDTNPENSDEESNHQNSENGTDSEDVKDSEEKIDNHKEQVKEVNEIVELESSDENLNKDSGEEVEDSKEKVDDNFKEVKLSDEKAENDKEEDEEVKQSDEKAENDIEEDENENQELNIPQYAATCGSTATVVLMNSKKVFVASVGDSRCVASVKGKAIELSTDHKPTDKEELERIRKAGFEVDDDGRIDGGLNMSRAFGDFQLKQNKKGGESHAVTCCPDITAIDISCDLDFIVIASDGIWNSMNNQVVVNYIHQRRMFCPLLNICKELFLCVMAPDTSGDGSGCDNMSVIIIEFYKFPESYDDEHPNLEMLQIPSNVESTVREENEQEKSSDDPNELFNPLWGLLPKNIDLSNIKVPPEDDKGILCIELSDDDEEIEPRDKAARDSRHEMSEENTSIYNEKDEEIDPWEKDNRHEVLCKENTPNCEEIYEDSVKNSLKLKPNNITEEPQDTVFSKNENDEENCHTEKLYSKENHGSLKKNKLTGGNDDSAVDNSRESTKEILSMKENDRENLKNITEKTDVSLEKNNDENLSNGKDCIQAFNNVMECDLEKKAERKVDKISATFSDNECTVNINAQKRNHAHLEDEDKLLIIQKKLKQEDSNVLPADNEHELIPNKNKK